MEIEITWPMYFAAVWCESNAVRMDGATGIVMCGDGVSLRAPSLNNKYLSTGLYVLQYNVATGCVKNFF